MCKPCFSLDCVHIRSRTRRFGMVLESAYHATLQQQGSRSEPNVVVFVSQNLFFLSE